MSPLKKKSLVTGGSVFLGSHLCTRLLEAGNKVICLDNYFNSKLDANGTAASADPAQCCKCR